MATIMLDNESTEKINRYTVRASEIKSLPENQQCCDCWCKETAWASTTFGCFLCINCSGVHRSLGTHISKVKSVTLDDWSESEVRQMELWGNKKVNEVFEANVPYYYTKPIDETPYDYRSEYINAKYVHQHFVKNALPPPSPHYSPLPNMSGVFQPTVKKQTPISKSKKITSALRKAETKNNKNSGQVEFCGILNIVLKRGIDMKSLNDTWSSDPYVVMGVGPDKEDGTNIYPGQLVKSGIKKRTLNPEWNENMCCCVANLETDTLHIEAWDYDKLSSDQYMGEYHLRLADLDILNQKERKVNMCVALQNIGKGSIELDLSYNHLK